MSYTPVPLEQIGLGANFRNGVDAVGPGEAIDLLNIDFTERGVIQSRPGFENFLSGGYADTFAAIAPFKAASGGFFYVLLTSEHLQALNPLGAEVALQAWNDSARKHVAWARVGQPGVARLWITDNDQVFVFSGSSFSVPTVDYTDTADVLTAGAAAPKPRCLAVMGDNRLMAAGFATTTGGPGGSVSGEDYVYVSEPGNPLAWSGFAYAQLRPGDGEQIMAACSWRDLTFVFKESAFFVFGMPSTNSEGRPYLNRKTIDTGIGCAAPHAVAVAADGVYFYGQDGIYRTRGEEPQLISDAISPVFVGGLSAYCQIPQLDSDFRWNTRLQVVREKLYVAYTGEGSARNTHMAVLDLRLGTWTFYDMKADAMCRLPDDELGFGGSLGHQLWRHARTVLGDNGASMATRWRSGWHDYGIPAVKTLAELKLWGAGQVGVKIGRDYRFDAEVTKAVDFDPAGETMSTLAAVHPDVVRSAAMRGDTFSIEFEQTVADGDAWSVHKVVPLLNGQDAVNVGRRGDTP